MNREIDELQTLLERSADLRDVRGDLTPSFERLAALSQVLNSFYTGLERIFERIASRADGSVPAGDRWHAELLTQMGQPSPCRSAVISEECQSILREYLAFRHRSRHAYAHHLDWRPMAHLVAGLPSAWDLVKGQIILFLEVDRDRHGRG